MFHSIKDAWLSASRNNMADVKELIPEFFYLPDFLLNSNKFDLGTRTTCNPSMAIDVLFVLGKKQNGVALNDVLLPEWSKNDPREFIRIHRMVRQTSLSISIDCWCSRLWRAIMSLLI
jgi:WD repeat and FYVE domain-containing protein 3